MRRASDVTYVRLDPTWGIRTMFLVATLCTCGVAAPIWILYELLAANRRRRQA